MTATEEPQKPHRSRSATRNMLIATALPLLLAVVIINLTWFEVSLVQGVAQQTHLVSSGADGTALVAILLACVAVIVVFLIVGKFFRYVLVVLQALFAVSISLITVSYIQHPLDTMRPELEKLTGLTGEHAFDNIVQSESLTLWPFAMFVVSAIMLTAIWFMITLIRVMPEATHRYDRTEKSSHEDDWGVVNEPEED